MLLGGQNYGKVAEKNRLPTLWPHGISAFSIFCLDWVCSDVKIHERQKIKEETSCYNGQIVERCRQIFASINS